MSMRRSRPADVPRPFVRLCSAAVWLVMACAAPVAAQDTDALAAARALESALVNAIERAAGCVVAISRADTPVVDRAGNPLDPLDPPGLVPVRSAEAANAFAAAQFGSGVIVAHPDQPQSRFILTTCHVVFGDRPPDAARTVQVAIHNADLGAVNVSARPFAADRRIDLAVLRLDLEQARISPDDVNALALGNAEGLERGRLVIALGNPYAMARDGVSSASIGIVSNLARRPQHPPSEGLPPESTSIHDYGTLLTVDTRLQLGASGGALLNLDGELIGITTALAALQGYEKSAGYAIPIDAGTRRIIDQLLNGHEADYGFLGISPEQHVRQDADGRRRRCVRAAHVAVDSPAHQAGLQVNDLIMQINGAPVRDVADLMRIIGLLGAGAEAQLQVIRRGNDEPQLLTAQLGKWPVYDDRDVLSTSARDPAWRGLVVDYPTARQRYLSSDRLEQYRRAVVVMQVDPASPAASVGLKSGDFIKAVDGVPVQSPTQFFAAVEGSTGPVELRLWNGETLRLSPQ